MKSPLEDTIWGASYGSVAAVRAAFDRFGPEYHEAIMASGVPTGAARALMPHLDPEAQGIDLGCGSGVLGLALRAEGLCRRIDGVDLSPRMLELARKTEAYGNLWEANLLDPSEGSVPPGYRYDFAVSVGLIGDYIPYYVALPWLGSILRPGAMLGFAVERRSTPSRALERRMAELGFTTLSETVLPVPAGALEEQFYHFFVVKLTGSAAQETTPFRPASTAGHT